MRSNPFLYFKISREVTHLAVMVYFRVNGVQHDLWRAVDHEGETLESYVTQKHDRLAALKFLKETMTLYGLPESDHLRQADKLRSYGIAMREIGN